MTAMVGALLVSGAAMSDPLTPCSQCDVQLHRCLTNGHFSYEQCMAAYERCRASNCDV